MSVTPNKSAEMRVRAAHEVAFRLTQAMDASLAEVGSLFPASAEWLQQADFAATSPIDSFLKRFENLVEAGRRLFRAALTQAGEDHRELSGLEVLRTMEKIGLLKSASDWAEIVGARNKAAHEYATDPAEAAEVLNEAHRAAERANAIVKTLLQALRARFPESSPSPGDRP